MPIRKICSVIQRDVKLFIIQPNVEVDTSPNFNVVVGNVNVLGKIDIFIGLLLGGLLHQSDICVPVAR